MKTLLLFTKAHDYVQKEAPTDVEGILAVGVLIAAFVLLIWIDAKVNNKKI